MVAVLGGDLQDLNPKPDSAMGAPSLFIPLDLFVPQLQSIQQGK